MKLSYVQDVFLFLLVFMTFNFQTVSSQSLSLNEVMSSNSVTIADQDGDYEDWLELHNYGTVPVNLNGFGLSDDEALPFKWIFPSATIEPGEFLLVWASGKNYTGTGAALHTNFSIKADGEVLLLTNPDQQLVDRFDPVIIPAGNSYGRTPDGTGELVFFAVPTPGQTNSTDPYSGTLDKVVFSSAPGFYSEPLNLAISHPDNEAVVYYTLDGSVPHTGSLQYSSPLSLTDKSGDDNQHSMLPTNYITDWRGWLPPDGKVAKSNIIRAIAVKPGYLDSPVSSGTWFVFPEGGESYSLDVVSLITDYDNLFSDATGIYVPGDKYVEGKPSTGNYFQTGDEWERPASFEFFGDDISFQQDIGIRIHGGWTRRDPIKSLRLYARDEYGENSLDYKIFPDLPYTSYKRLLLRQSGNDWAVSLFRDALAQHLIGHMDLDIMAYRPTVVFINGEYWGIKNLRERYDKFYLERVYEVDPENIDYLTAKDEGVRVEEGDALHYNRMIEYITTNDMSNDSLFSLVPEMMDIDNYLDYYTAQIFYQNTDWPANNIDFWRLRVEYNENTPEGHDGRWRWLPYDMDRALGLFYDYDYKFNMMAFITAELNNGREWPNLLFRNLIKNENFKNALINRIADHLNTTFLPSRVLSAISEFSQRIESEIPEHSLRWGYPSSKIEWDKHIQRLNTNAINRPSYVREHLMGHFGIESMISLTAEIESADHGYIRVNSIDIIPSDPGFSENPYPWTGSYFQGVPIVAEAFANEEYSFSHWSGTGITAENQNNKVLEIVPDGNMTLEAHYTYTGLPDLISYWFLGDDLPNDTPLDTIFPTFNQRSNTFLAYQSALEGYPFTEEHELWRTASLERRNSPTEINYLPEANDNILFEVSGMRGIQVTQPLATSDTESALIFNVPSHGFSDISFRFAAKDEGAAESLVIDYSVTAGDPVWTNAGLDNPSMYLTGDYQLYLVDLSGTDDAGNNPHLKIRLRFEGTSLTVSEGNRVTFNNFSLHGFPMDLDFFSKPSGDLNNPASWGTNEDGSGDPPSSFDINAARFFIYNRESVIVNGEWHVGGLDSRVIAGDDVIGLSLLVNSAFTGTVDLMTGSTIELAGNAVPGFYVIKDGTTVTYTGASPTISYASYYNLVINNINPLFEKKGTIGIRGDLELTGDVQMPDARGHAEYNLRFSGNDSQLISGNGNIIRGYDIVFDKSGGTVNFSEGNGGTVLSHDNQLEVIMSDGALFEDNGITIYSGNSINISGLPESYNLTGTLILAGSEEGVVSGAGSGNNFNVRDSNGNNSNAAAVFNNLIIRATNQDGEFRFRDGGSNQVTVKGDFIVESAASGRLRFYENNILVGGNLIIEDGFSGIVDTVYQVIFNGQNNQTVSLSDTVHTQILTLTNQENILLDGNIKILGNLHFNAGLIAINEGTVIIGAGAEITGYGEQSYIDGPLGYSFNETVPREIIFPVGKSNIYKPVTLELGHTDETENLYVVEFFPDPPPEMELSGLAQVFGDYHYSLSVTGDAGISTSKIILEYDSGNLPIDESLLRIAKTDGDQWVNYGGVATGGLIGSAIPLTTSGLIALGEQAAGEASITATAGEGGTIDPAGISVVTHGTDKTYIVTAGEGYHIQNILVDGEALPDAPENVEYEYTFTNIEADKTIHADFILITYSGLPEDSSLEVNMYPNPASDVLWIEFARDPEHKAVITLVNMNGRVVSEKIFSTGTGNIGYLTLTGIEPGMYIIRVSNGELKFHRRIMIF